MRQWSFDPIRTQINDIKTKWIVVKYTFSDSSNDLEQCYEEKELTFLFRAEKNSMLSHAIMPYSACVMQIQQ